MQMDDAVQLFRHENNLFSYFLGPKMAVLLNQHVTAGMGETVLS